LSALGVPAALLLGLVAELAGTLVLRLAGRGERARPWFRPARDLWRDVRRLVRRRDRASGLELVGIAAALTGAGLAAAAAMGFLAGSVSVVYPALVLAAVGGHVTASLAPGSPGREAAVGSRIDALVAEPAFVVALGGALLRWGAFDLEAVRGAQQVLGPGIAVGPPVVTGGLIVAVVVVLVAGAFRLPAPSEGRGRSRPAGSAVAVALCRWAAAGATAMVAGVLLAGGSSLAPGALDPVALARWVGAAVGAALVLGAAPPALSLLSRRVPRVAISVGVVVLAVAAATLVAVG
jgi:hypothetical protein